MFEDFFRVFQFIPFKKFFLKFFLETSSNFFTNFIKNFFYLKKNFLKTFWIFSKTVLSFWKIEYYSWRHLLNSINTRIVDQS